MFQERRTAPLGVELRASESGDGFTLSGYASTWQPYDVTDYLGSYTETMKRGAFAKTLNDGADVRLLFNHDGMPLARTKSGTLRLSEDETGLRAEADLDPNSSFVRDMKSAMDRGDLDQMSFAFSAVRQSWSADYTQRDVTEARLFDVSVVTYPANPTTSVGLRSAAIARFGTRAWGDIDKQLRAGTLDDVARDILLQVIGALDAAGDVVDDATEVLEALASVAPEADADGCEGCECGAVCDCADCPMTTAPQQNAATWPAEYRWFPHTMSA